MELPASFIDYTRSLLGDEEYDKLAVAIQQEPPFFKQKTAYEIYQCDWSSDVCSSDL